jgi:glutamate dehydrogenase
VQNELMSGVDWLVEAVSRWYLVQPAGQRLAEAIEESRDAFAELSRIISTIGPESWREQRERTVLRLLAAGVPEEVARRHAFQAELVHGPDIISIAHESGRSVEELSRAFFLLGERLDIDWLEFRLEELPAGSKWQRWAVQSMEDDIFLVRRQLVERAIAESDGEPMDQAIERFLERREEAFARLQRFMRGLAMEGVSDLAHLTVALRQVRALVG